MPDQPTIPAGAIPPPRRPELIIRPAPKDGQFIVKDRRTEAFFQMGSMEVFLLECLDGKRTAETIQKEFEERFKEPLPVSDLVDFLKLAAARDLIQLPVKRPAPDAQAAKAPTQQAGADQQVALESAPRSKPRQSILFWRFKFFDT